MALIYTRQVRPLGFKGTDMFVDSKWHLNYYRTFPEECVVLGVCGGTIPEGVFRFNLTKAQMKAFETGKLGLIPPDCCSPCQHPVLDNWEWVHEGTINNLRHLKQILASTGLFPDLCKKPKSRSRG